MIHLYIHFLFQIIIFCFGLNIVFICIFVVCKIKHIIIEEFCGVKLLDIDSRRKFTFFYVVFKIVYFFHFSLLSRYIRKNHNKIGSFLLLHFLLNICYLFTLGHYGPNLDSLKDLSCPRWFLTLAVQAPWPKSTRTADFRSEHL